MAPTKSAGRVSIRVLPDSTRFREDLKKTLDRIENSMKVNIKVNPVMDRSQLAELKRQIEELQITIRPDIDLTVPTGDIEKIKAAIESMDPQVNIDLKTHTAAAQARISALTRDRVVNIWPWIHKAAVNNFTRHLAAIAGASFITQEITKGLAFLRQIDQHAVRMAKMATLIGGLVAVIGTTTQAVLGLGDGIIKIMGLLTVAPALMSSLGIALGVFIPVMKDMKEVLADLGPAFSRLQDTMSSRFWREAAPPIRDLVNHLMPTLSEKMNAASVSLGQLTGAIAVAFKAFVPPESFGRMFDRVIESMDTMQGAVAPIIYAFALLGEHGTKYLNRLSKAIVGVSEDFARWTQANYFNGNLARWTESAIWNFKQLGGVIKGVWDVFGALNTAAKTAGGPSLATMHTNLDNLAKLMDSPGFQKATVHVFRGMNTATRDIIRGIGEMGEGFGKLAPTIEVVFGSIGRSFRVVLNYLGEMMAHPIMQKGIQDVFFGIEGALKALKPAMEPFTVALGSLLTLMGTVIKNVGELVSTILVEWGPSLQKLSDVFDTLAEPLRVMLEDVVKALTPAIEVLIDRAIIPLLEWIRDDLIPAVSDFAINSGPELVKAMELIGDVIDGLLPILKSFTDFFSDADGEASDFKKTLDGINLFLNDPRSFVNKTFEMKIYWNWDESKTKEMADGLKKDADAEVERAFNEGRGPGGPGAFNKWVADLFAGVGDSIERGWKNIDWMPNTPGKNSFESFVYTTAKKWDGGWADIQDGFTRWWATSAVDWDNWYNETNGKLSGFWNNIGQGWEGFWFDVGTSWNNFWGDVGNNINESLDNMDASMQTWWDDMGTGWDGFMNDTGGTINFGMEEIKGFFDTHWGTIESGLRSGFEATGLDYDGFMAGMKSTTELNWTDIATNVGVKGTEIKNDLKTKLDGMGIDTSTAWSTIKGVADRGWGIIKQTVVNWAKEMYHGVVNWVMELPGKIARAFGMSESEANRGGQRFKEVAIAKFEEFVNWLRGLGERMVNAIAGGGDLSGSGASLMQSFIDGMQSKLGLAETTAAGIMAGIKAYFPNSPAKKGPLSGRGYTSYSGRAVVDAFAGGMEERMRNAQSVTHRIAAGVSSGLSNISATHDEMVSAGGREGGSVTVKVYNPIAEPTSRTMERASAMIRLGAKT